MIYDLFPVERYDAKMFVAVTNCVTYGGAFFFQKSREARPLDCSLLDLRELADETGISVDDVISRLDDFVSADALMGFGVPLAEPLVETICTPIPEEEPTPIFSVEKPEPLFVEEQPPVFTVEQPELIFEETQPEAPIFETMQPQEPIFQAAPVEDHIEVNIIEEIEKEQPVIEEAPPIVAVEPSAPPPEKEALRAEAATTADPSPAPAEETKAPALAHTHAPRRKLFSTEGPLSKMTRARLEKIRKLSTIRVETAEEDDEMEDEHLIDLNVPDGYAVQTTTENIVWPWEIREDLTLKEALEALDDKLLASLTEEVVSCTISGQMGEGGIKSLCETYGREKEQIYSAVQHESRRRITRMNTKPHTAPSQGPDATQEMAMRMAKQFLQNEMGKKAMRFKSPFPDENGIYHIFQSHRVEDEDAIEFPNERVYYREVGDGWAISVGY